jgi:hypothetical protein
MTDHFDGAPGPLGSLPVPKAPFLPSDRFSIHRVGTTDSSNLTVYLFHDVVEELIFSARFQPAHKTTGFLTGGYYTGPAGEFVELRGFCDSAVVDNVQTFTRRLGANWHRLRRDRELLESGLVPLGWFVSKPDCGGKLGPYELICHLTYFNLPYHLCLVLDPIRHVLGLYRQVADGRLTNIGFNLIKTTKHRED